MLQLSAILSHRTTTLLVLAAKWLLDLVPSSSKRSFKTLIYRNHRFTRSHEGKPQHKNFILYITIYFIFFHLNVSITTHICHISYITFLLCSGTISMSLISVPTPRGSSPWRRDVGAGLRLRHGRRCRGAHRRTRRRSLTTRSASLGRGDSDVDSPAVFVERTENWGKMLEIPQTHW